MLRRTDVLVVLALVLLAAGFGLGVLLRPDHAGHSTTGGTVAAPATEKTDVVWTCSMHPQIRMPGPGKCPICHMDLIPVEDSASADDSDVTLTMSESARRLAEIRTAPVRRAYPDVSVRLVGKVDVDETRERTISAWVAGRLDRLYVDFTGISVREGDHMVEIYSPELVSAQEELLQALRADSEMGSGAPAVLRETGVETVRAARDKLRLLGLTSQQIQRIEDSGEVRDEMTLYSPIDGVVTRKHQVEGDYVRTGDPIYELADLGHLWVKLDAYESDLPWLRYGQQVQFTTESMPGRTFTGRIAFIDPVLDTRTRTARVRVNVENPDGALKPGMFVRAVVKAEVAAAGKVMVADLAGKWIGPMHPEIVSDGPGQCPICGMDLVKASSLGYEVAERDAEPPLVIPATAPLITGTRAVVYVRVPATDRPTYEGREVVLGPRAGDVYLVDEGLAEGEEVVVHGAFKIDSAMQIQARPSMMMPDDTAPAPVDRVVEAPQAFREQLATVYRSYLDVVAALAADDVEGARVAAGAVVERLEGVQMELLGHESHQVWMQILPVLRDAATSFAEAQDLSAQRAALPGLTEALADAVRRMGLPQGTGAHLLHCPMAFEGEGADWIQAGTDVRNPYFGDAMLGCGNPVEDLAKRPEQR